MGIFTDEDLETLREFFPKLDPKYDKVTSGPTYIQRSRPGQVIHHEPYNCVAWAFDSDTQWFQYDPEGECGFKTFWPENLTDDDTVEGYIELFRAHGGYEIDDLNEFLRKRF